MSPDEHMVRVEKARDRLNAIPWWRPIKRQDAARTYRYALYLAALDELRSRR